MSLKCFHWSNKHVQRQRQNTTITLQMEPMKRENTDCDASKSDGEIKQCLQFTVKLPSSIQR